MVTSLKNLKNEVDSRLAGGGLDALACCQLQNAKTILNNNIVTSVANTASLPSNTLNEGRFVYVEDINEYRLANDASWTDDVSSGVCIYQTQIWGWGKNNCGQLGNGTGNARCSPVREFCSATDWCQLSVGSCNTIAIKTSGELWAWGANQCFNLGDGTLTSRFSPVREFCSATDWCQVGNGHQHTAAVKTTGQIWAWGNNNIGQLGDGTTTVRCSPVREFCSATDWCQVGAASLGGFHTAALKTSGELWSWGGGNQGRIGDGTAQSRCSPVREFCSATDWCFLDVGYTSTVAIKTSGELWLWGRSSYGPLGDGAVTDRCSPVREFCSATDWCYVNQGRKHTVAIKTSGELWAWGDAAQGRLGNGITTACSCSPVREFCSATNWCQASTGHRHSAAVKTSGELWAWGFNNIGQLGDGTTTVRCSPVREFCSATDWCQVGGGYYHTLAIRTANKGFLE